MEGLRNLGCCLPVKVDRFIRSASSSTLSSRCSSSKRSWRRRSLRLKDSVHDKNSPVVCFGEIQVDLMPNDSGVSLADASGFKKAPGGAPAIAAVAISRLGGYSAFIGKVGQDEFGYMLNDVLEENHVDNSGLCYDQNARTALSFVTLRSDGEREFMFYRNPSADMLLEESELDETLIRKGIIFHYGSTTLIEEPSKTAHLAAMDIAKNAGCLLSYDPNLRLQLWPSPEAARKSIMDIWELADIIKVSEEEVKFLIQSDGPIQDETVVKKLFHSNLKLLLVTEGSNGCRYYTQMFQGRAPGFTVDSVDTTGAGDAFMGGFLKKLGGDRNLYRHEKKLKDAVMFANACGAITVTEKGAIPALPTKLAVLEFLSRCNNYYSN